MASANRRRRDIERRLHDGVQQDLIALAVTLQLAEVAAGSDPAERLRLLRGARQDVHDAIEGLRTLARDVYPPLLTDLGLAAALRGAAADAALAVQLQIPGDRYAPDVEAAVYFSCLEALQLIAACGATGPATVRVWRDGGSLRFEVVANVGAAPEDGWLEALQTDMNDRVGAMGGTMTLSADAKRAIVRGAIPLPGGP